MIWVALAVWAVAVALGLRLSFVTKKMRVAEGMARALSRSRRLALRRIEALTPNAWDGKGPEEACLLLITDGNVQTWVDCSWDSGEIEGPGGERARVAPYYVTPWGEDATRVGRITHWARRPDASTVWVPLDAGRAA